MATLLAGRKLISKSGPAAPDALQGKVVLLYFSASWCGPCHQFTPILKDFYEEIVGENFEIVYVPGDKSVQEMMQYYHGEHADYLALDMSDVAFIQHLNQRYQVRGIPHCVVIQPDGSVIDGDARSSVQAGPASFRRWKATWNAGTKVAIQGLVGAAQHNGKTGTLLSFDSAKGRFTVALDGGGGGTPQLAVKPGNVAVQALGLGQKVSVFGLQGAPQHNGKRGVVAGGLNQESGRYAVKVEGEENALGLKLGNLELAEAADARGGGGGAGPAPAPAAARGGLPNVTLRNTSGRPL